MSKENTEKNEHGMNGKKALQQMIEALKERRYICDYQIDYRIGDPEFGEKQFFFQAMIEFENHEEWILHSTTSIRDRITEQQWHSQNIKRLNEYVKRAYVVVPDALSEKERINAENYDRKIQEKRIFSALDGVVPFEKAYQMIEHKGAELLGSGTGQARLGLHFEEKIVDAMNNEDNLKRWKGEAPTATGYLYELFLVVMNALGLSPSKVVNVKATSKIPKLPNGGSPKTDVLMEVECYGDSKEKYTFSCKRSTEDRVSVHEYTADAFSKVLCPEDQELRVLLNRFQEVGGVRAMNDSDVARLEEKLKKYETKLNRWAMGGIGGDGDPKTQWANYIITLSENTNEYKVYSIDEYITLCHKNGVNGQLGTIFQWTYPSGGKGKRIQLKGKVI